MDNKIKKGKYILKVFKVYKKHLFDDDPLKNKDLKNPKIGKLIKTVKNSAGEGLDKLLNLMSSLMLYHYKSEVNNLYYYVLYDTEDGSVYFNNLMWTRVICAKNQKELEDKFWELECDNSILRMQIENLKEGNQEWDAYDNDGWYDSDETEPMDFLIED